MKTRSYKKRGGDIASTVGLGDKEENESLMDKVSNGASSLKDKITGLFSGGRKSRRIRFSMKKRKSKKGKTSKRKSTKRKSTKRKSTKRK